MTPNKPKGSATSNRGIGASQMGYRVVEGTTCGENNGSPRGEKGYAGLGWGDPMRGLVGAKSEQSILLGGGCAGETKFLRGRGGECYELLGGKEESAWNPGKNHSDLEFAGLSG